MDESPESEDLPAVSIVEFSDPTLAGQGFELVVQDAVQLQSVPFQARRVIVRLGDASVVLHSTNGRVRTRTTPQKGLLGYVAFDPKSTGSVNGLAVRPGLLLAVEPNAEASFVTDVGWKSISFLLRPDYIGAHLVARQREDEFRMPRGVEALEVDAAMVQRLFEWGNRLVDAAVSNPAIFNDSADRRKAAQVDLVEILLATLHQAVGRTLSRTELTKVEQSRIVKTAEEFALSHLDERLYISDLCRVTGFSERSLEYAFKETLGMAPIAFLTRLRLYRVRDALQSASSDSRTITDIALAWGFWHYGEFSRAYKECFGELPSETLRRHRLEQLGQG